MAQQSPIIVVRHGVRWEWTVFSDGVGAWVRRWQR
jgi:hypothetical protein